MQERYIELLQIVLGMVQFAGVWLVNGSYFDPQPVFKAVQICLASAGVYFEGIRMVQVPFYLGIILPALISTIFMFAAQMTLSFEPIFYLGVLGSFYLRMNYGVVGFQRFGQPSGPYEVGYRKAELTSAGNACSVYYPVDKGTKAGSPKPVMMVQHGDDQVASIKKVVKFLRKGNPDLPEVLIKPNLATTIPVLRDAPLSKDFKELIPIVFSHGFGANRMIYSGLAREFASYGFLVVTLDHLDGSCDHTVKSEAGETVTFVTEKKHFDADYRLQQVDFRVAELYQLMQQMSEPAWIEETLETKDISLKSDHFILAGHSMGGATALKAGFKRKDFCESELIKGVLCLDPWLFPLKNEITTNELKYGEHEPPILLVYSTTFPEKVGVMSEWADNQIWYGKKFLQEAKTKIDQVELRGYHHENMFDYSVTMPIETYIEYGKLPHKNRNEVYRLNAQLALRFFDRHGLLPNLTKEQKRPYEAAIESLKDIQWWQVESSKK